MSGGNLGKIVVASHVRDNHLDPRRMRTIILLLATSVALMMTGFGIIMPVFARRLAELGAGVEALGIMTTAFALTQLAAAPFLGSLADRYGRRPFVLLALVAFIFTNVGYLLAGSVPAFIAVRALGGLFTAGLFPAAMGVVADVSPEAQRARWIGVIMGGYGAGFVFGPVLGGVLYDNFGFAAPFTTSAGMGVLALLAAALLVTETRPPQVRRREALRQRWVAERNGGGEETAVSVWDALPRPLAVFSTLLFLDFIGSFAFAFVEPQMVFYLYDQLNWTTAQFGIVVGVYGMAMMLGQLFLGQASDRFGRKPVIVLGQALNLMLYVNLAFVHSYALVMAGSFIAGLGAALTAPAISAFYLDMTARQHRSRVIGIKEASLSLGGVLGPLLVVVATRYTSAQGVFLIAGALMLFSVLLALLVLRSPRQRLATDGEMGRLHDAQRSQAAEVILRGLVLQAARARGIERG
ncbi:MAG: MFS transporter [Anaerolineales bacterium]|nr:MFS transporter [Anaerolineales bacterium]